MLSDWLWLLTFGTLAVMADALSTTLMEDVKKADQAMRPKVKRAQELLMFGNQQNRQAENAGSNLYSPTAEKRTLGSSGLDDVKAAFAQGDKFGHAKSLSSSIFDRKSLSPYDKNYEYSKVLVNQIGDGMPRTWDVPPYPRYYNMVDDRHKRSDNPTTPIRSTTTSPAPPLPPVAHSPQQIMPQVKKSLPIYQEPRYKRELDLDPEDVLSLLSLWENERRNRNWLGYENDEYDNVEDDGNLIDVDDEDPRNGGSWLEGPVYPPRHFSIGTDSLTPSDIGIPRTHPANYYEQYGNQFGQQYGGGQYGSAQYGSAYPQQSYYPPEKRFMVSRKRSQNRGNYGGQYDIVNLAKFLESQPGSYSGYQHRVVY